MKLASLVFFVSLLTASAALAGDRVGNGGGLWGCYTPEGRLEKAALVDFYEAENEHDWTLAGSSRTEAWDIVAELGSSVRTKFPDYYPGWSRLLEDTRGRINYTNSELTVVEDSLYRVKPLPELCRTPWKYVQFANYTYLNKVQIRKDLWDSPVVTAYDKAGLVWHEVIYRWMREQFGDKDSVRARQITGILFSTLEGPAARRALDEVLKQGELAPSPERPIWACEARNTLNFRFFLDYGTNELAARNQSVRTCQLADPDAAFHCAEHSVRCDAFASMLQSHTCAVKNNLTQVTYTETGRSRIEAEAKARRSCGDTGQGVHCETMPRCL